MSNAESINNGNNDKNEKLFPPKISREQIDRLLDRLKNGNSTNDEHSLPSLQGRQVMIPYGRCAFWEGELQPKKITKKDENKGIVSSSATDEEEEEVFVATSSSLRSYPNDNNTDGSNSQDAVSMTFSDAIQWLQKYSSSTTSTSSNKKTTIKSSIKSTIKTKPQPPASTPTALPFVEIQEEYTDDGKQVYGKAVDISSKLQSLWKQEESDRRKEEQKYQSDNDDENGEYGVNNQTQLTTEHVLCPETERTRNDSISEISNSKAEKPEVLISDQEYDRISKRLEELAFLEEQELQQQQVRVSQPKRKHSNKKPTIGAFQFQKGFLNAKSKKVSAKTIKETTTTKIDMPQQPPSEPAVTEKSKITIDTSKNTIQEIPKEGNQQPVPPKQSSSSSATSGKTMLAQNIFSGNIQERPQQQIVPTRANIVGVTTTNNDSNNNKNPAPKKKRVSRFAQERMVQW
jgi:hypothetical protein